MTKTKTPIQHSDLFGQPLEIGDCVVFPDSNMMQVGTVLKLNPKMVGVRSLGRTRGHSNKYPRDLLRVEGADVTKYRLKNKK